jgi:copper chaperone CopZ
MEILVFKTDISNRRAVNKVIPHLENIQGIVRCNVDLHDRDKILRIESKAVSPRLIEQQVQQAGHYCKELED